MATPTGPADALDVRFFEPPQAVTVRVAGLDPALAALASDHWAAAATPTEPTGPAARPVLAVGRGDRRRQRHRSRSTTGSGDFLSLPGGRLRVHPDGEVVEALPDAVPAAHAWRLTTLCWSARRQAGSRPGASATTSASGMIRRHCCRTRPRPRCPTP